MVQILKNRNTSFLDALGEGAASGARSFGEVYPQIQQYQREKTQNAAVDNYLKKLGIEDTENLPYDFKKMLFSSDMKSQEAQKKAQAAGVIDYPFVDKTLKSLQLSNEQLKMLGPQGIEAITNRSSEILSQNPTIPKEQAVSAALNKFLNQGGESNLENPFFSPQQNEAQPQLQEAQTPEEQEGFLKSGEKGIQRSIAGRASAIAQGIPFSQYEKANELQNPSFLNRLTSNVSTMGANLPFHLAGAQSGAMGGGALGSFAGPYGAATGTAIGGGAGFVALPAMLDTALSEYHKYLESGGDEPFDAFVNGLDKTLKAAGGGAMEGAMFSMLSEAMPIIKTLPGMDKLFKAPGVGKAAEKAVKGGVEAGGYLGAKSLSEQKLPSKEEIADTFAMVIGFNLFDGLSSKAKETISKRINESGASPDNVAKELKNRIETGEIDSEKAIIREITDITKDYLGAEKKAGIDTLNVLRDIKTENPKEMAKKLAERPVEEAIQYEKKSKERREKPLTEKEQAKRDNAREKADDILKMQERVQDDISYLKENTSKGPKQNRQLAEVALKAKEAELAELKKDYAKQEGIAERGVEPFSEEALKEPIEKHLDQLHEAAKDPESLSAKEWEKMFDRDQKYLKDYEKILEKGELPDAKFKDRYIKTLEEYQKAYKNVFKELVDKIRPKQEAYDKSNKRTKQAKELKKEIDHLQRKLNFLDRNSKINDAKVGKQKDKLAQLYQLKKPGSALTRQILKNMRKDLVDLQKDFIKQKKELNAFEKKTESAAKEVMKENAKLFKEYSEKPSQKLQQKIADANNIPVKDVSEAFERSKKEAKKIADQIKKGATLKETQNSFDKYTKYLKRQLKSLPLNVAISIAATELQGLFKEITGKNIPISYLSFFIPGSLIARGGRQFISSMYKELKHDFKKDSMKEEFKKLKTMQQKFNFVEKLKKDFSKKEIDEIIGQ